MPSVSGTLDLVEMWFDGAPETWLDWWDEAHGMGGRYDGYPDFMAKAQARSAWLPRAGVDRVGR